MSVYRWVTGSHIRGSAQAAGEECAKLEMRGELTPKALVDESRPEDAPLHDMFNWNDEEAAELYRQTQAQYIIRSIEVVAVGDSKPVKAFVSVQTVGKSRIYQNTEVALSIPDTRDQVLQAALAELRAFERKYGRLEELADVITAIRQVA